MSGDYEAGQNPWAERPAQDPALGRIQAVRAADHNIHSLETSSAASRLDLAAAYHQRERAAEALSDEQWDAYKATAEQDGWAR